MDSQNKDGKTILRELFQKEKEVGCFEYVIEGTSIYRFVRRSLITRLMKSSGIEVMKIKDAIDYKSAFKSVLVSVLQITKLLISGRKYDTVFLPFMRIDKVGGWYMDKFTDPLIELCFKDKEGYIIFDQGRAGVHARPRMHENHCVQTDCLVAGSRYYSKLFWKSFYRKYKDTIDGLYDTIIQIDSNCGLTKTSIAKYVCSGLRYQRYFEILFKRLKAKRVIGPTRRRAEFTAAHKLGMKAYECQHGISYGETIMYGGFQPKEYTPDNFLAFGNNNPIDVYGIAPEKIVNIGWALNNIIASSKDFIQYNTRDVLVISDPEITDSIINFTLLLAKANPESHFYVRPHPHEKISESQKNRLESLPNAHWQDKRINIAMVMQGFTHVVGENSTVLYEALAVGKKVAKLYCEGLHPRYLREEDKDCFWEVRDEETFSRFLNEDISTKKAKSIYSPFNKELFMQTIGIG